MTVGAGPVLSGLPEGFVTVSVGLDRKADERAEAAAAAEAASIGWEYVRRKRLAGRLSEVREADVLVFETESVRLIRCSFGKETCSLRFHPSTAPLRIAQAKAGKEDVMVGAMRLRKGDSVLDCTMGLGSDALVAAWTVGESGHVVALEASRPIYLAMDYGMRGYRADADVASAASRIERINEGYSPYLRGCGDGSFDVVYMDPMFARPVPGTPVDSLRTWAVAGMPGHEDLEHALKAARRRVVIKVRKGEAEKDLRALPGFCVFHSSRSGSVEYVGFEKAGSGD
ncbi:MAG: Ribosomal RNA small subunit methyltransferase J [Firmicutes bacterium ADurb.Bin153]|nr:MAG: Ribosomal RNA small subunit methyltransferase J [Firmicutes bacterium ADurb.Bin153]